MEGEEVVLASLGRVPAGLELDVQQAGGGSYRKASAAPGFAAHERWRKLDMVVPLGLCLPMLGFVGWAHGLRASGAMVTMVTLMSVAVGVLTFFALWYLVAYASNRSTLHVSSDALRLTNGPVPWPWRRDVELTPSPELDVHAVAVRREVKELSPQMRREFQRTGVRPMTTRWWNVVAVAPNGEVVLFPQLDREQAHYLAERIRRTLR
ncbi:MAG: hypothetical protein JJ863_10110 [Deltaproteobacteria bacterium]|nr:hypothetical protein [Deltaproteobacteria bacterium]